MTDGVLACLILNDNMLVDYVDAFDLLGMRPGELVKKDNFWVSSGMFDKVKVTFHWIPCF